MKSPAPAPTKTPHRLPSMARSEYPASSTAFQASSRKKHCWGSISSASLGEMLKNSESNSLRPSRNPPHLQLVLLGLRVSGSYQAALSQRLGGTSLMPDCPC